MRRRILVIPAVSDLGAFSRLISQIGHYFGHVQPERITVLVDPDLRRDAEAWLASPAPPPAYADGVVPRIEAVRKTIALASWPRDLEPLALTTDVVLDWDVRRSGSEPWASIKSRYRLDKSLFTVDWEGIRLGAARFADAARILGNGRGFDRSQPQAFAGLCERLGRAERAYLVGTGPSARNALEHDLSDGIRIICNTVVLDDELMEHLRPQILTFADPIFHFGPSTYAQRFQSAVAEQARKHDFTVITTERYAPLLRAHLPEIANRVIGFRQGTASWPDSFDLLAHAAVRPHPNVLTMLMLPIAATVARSIGLIGFDGRDPRDEYFWRHGSTVQFDEELKDIRLVHPGFFELSYEDYYSDHVATVDRLFAVLEERCTEIRPMAESYIPALRRRAGAAFKAPARPSAGSPPRFVSLTPDWISDFGHFGPFERRFHEVAEAAGQPHIALASAGLLPAADWQLPTFSEPTFTSTGRFAPIGKHFERELRAALEQLALPSGAVAFLYTADVWHLAAVLAVAVDHPDLRFVVNLMRSHGWLDLALEGPNPWIESLLDLLRSCLSAAARLNVDVTVDSEALARDVLRLTGQAVDVWPMIVVSRFLDGTTERHLGNGVPHVVAPVQAQGGKGFPELVALAERVNDRLARGELRLTARWPADGMRPEMVRLAERFEAHGGRLVKDNLSDEAFVELVASADVALIPYRVRPFRTRTSAVTIDALLAGKPVVAVRGTWAGDLIERHGAGLTYADGDVADMDVALSQVIDQIDDYRQRVADIRTDVAAEHAPERLIEFLSSAPNDARPEPDVLEQVVEIQARTNDMRRLFQWHAVAEDAARMAAVIREDDQLRTIDGVRDEVEKLTRAIAHRDRTAAANAAADVAAASPPAIEGTHGRQGSIANGTRRRVVSRRRGITRATTGALRAVFVISGLMTLLAAGLVMTGSTVPALLALAGAVVASVMGSLVVAVRLERRG